MSKYVRRHCSCRFAALLFSAAFGGLLIVLAAAVLSAAELFLLRDVFFIRFISTAALIIGSLGGGFFCGKIRGRHGLTEGSICGLVLYLLICAASLFCGGSPASPIKLLFTVIPSAIGGVYAM